MELSSEDIKRLADAGYCPKEFAIVYNGVPHLRNVDGVCYFYSLADKKCRVYEKRPLGCYLYPIVHMEDEGAVVDELCPMGETVSEQELKMKARILKELLEKIDIERNRRFFGKGATDI